MRHPFPVLSTRALSRIVVLLAVVTVLLASRVGAQGLRIEQPPPDCNLARKAYDNPLSEHHGWVMRRYQWHALYFATNAGLAAGIHRVTKLPLWASSAISLTVTRVAPHVYGGLIKRQYPIKPLDWAFDAFNGSAPLWWSIGESGNTWQSKTLAATTFVGGYFALACYASP